MLCCSIYYAMLQCSRDISTVLLEYIYDYIELYIYNNVVSALLEYIDILHFPQTLPIMLTIICLMLLSNYAQKIINTLVSLATLIK